MNLRWTLLVGALVIAAGAAGSYWYLHRSDKPNRTDGTNREAKSFKVGFLPVT